MDKLSVWKRKMVKEQRKRKEKDERVAKFLASLNKLPEKNKDTDQ